MSADGSAAARLQEANDPAAVLTAAYDLFEDILTVLWQQQERPGHMFAAFVMSAAAAADGRDAVAAAPSLPAARPRTDPTARPDRDVSVDEVADGLAALSGLLARRLGELAGSAGAADDRTVCAEAARAAERIHSLLRGIGR